MPPFSPCPNPSAQAEEIYEKNLFQTEAHVHILANLFKVNVIIIGQAAAVRSMTRIMGTVYKPGYNPQKLTTRPALRALKEGAVPCVFLHSDNPPTHYSAFTPPEPPAARNRKARVKPGGTALGPIDLEE